MTRPVLIKTVRAIAPAKLEIEWSTGEVLPVDVSRWLMRYKLYAPLRDVHVFRKLHRDVHGHSVRWGRDVDMGADMLYEAARTQAGEWGPEAFDDWMTRNDLSLTSAADVLGMTRRMMAHYRTGSRPIPRVVMLACKGWEAVHIRDAA